jgi:hypothetical protein
MQGATQGQQCCTDGYVLRHLRAEVSFSLLCEPSPRSPTEAPSLLRATLQQWPPRAERAARHVAVTDKEVQAQEWLAAGEDTDVSGVVLQEQCTTAVDEWEGNLDQRLQWVRPEMWDGCQRHNRIHPHGRRLRRTVYKYGTSATSMWECKRHRLDRW